MKLNYKQKLFLSFFIVFVIFIAGILIFEQAHERKFKTEILMGRLDTYAGMANTVIINNCDYIPKLDSLSKIFPTNIRLSLINEEGIALYDNAFTDPPQMRDHFTRAEIQEAQKEGVGFSIRMSNSRQQTYLYYAKRFDSYYIRMALPYNVEVAHFLKADNVFIYFIIGLFLLGLFIINIVASRFGKSINQLKDFALTVESEKQFADMQFSHDELGEIGAKIADNYRQMRENKKEIILEREKLLQHVHSVGEGICFFNAGKKVEFYNGLFIQHLNTLIEEISIDPLIIFSNPVFDEIKAFLENPNAEHYIETTISRQGKHFALRVNRFDDNGFELIINDITQQEKTRQLKQEMTGNIAHELRTPITGIRGYLETILEQSLDADKQHYFINRAYSQTLLLSELIQDMEVITKIEDAPYTFPVEPVEIKTLIAGVCMDLEKPIQKKNIIVDNRIRNDVTVKGSRHLLYSIFRNLTENVIRYAGTDVTITIQKYNEDKDYYYFSYADTGVGVPDEQHLVRLFERFYRVNDGRTRHTGGSGLGLSIVKNAVTFHKGTIIAKNKAVGGLELLFTLAK
ncbi:MAG: two-component sensor histidine kinase [Prevotellaceae bacterium]|jgi:signal transduction histidine kinase|nr:two-component sensor histidine kinase [Prevotellaceae bacterium]